MCSGRHLVTWVICAAIGVVCVTGCGIRSTPQVAVTTTIAEGETPTGKPTREDVLTGSDHPTSTPRVISPVAPSPTVPTPTTTPTAQPHTPTAVQPTEEPYYENRTGPVGLLASYYNAINRQEYARAWAYWESPPNPSYQDFVAGFADTASVALAVRPPTWFEGAAGSTYTSVPALVSATHVDGSRHRFVGCFVARRSNVEELGVDHVWSLFDVRVQPTPNNSADALLLVGACGPAHEGSYDDRTGPVRLLASYYNAIDRGEYGRAWAYWETPPAPSVEAFAEGFADTESVTLVVRPPTRLEGAAGSLYAAVPVLLRATHRDGSRPAFVGCFVARRPNVGGPGVEQLWSLFDAEVQRTPGNATDVTLLDTACAGQ